MYEKSVGLIFLILAAVVSLPAAFPSGKSLELSLFGGYGLTRCDGDAVHEDTWSFSQLTRVWERTDIFGEGKNPFVFGAEAVLYFNRSFGVGVSYSTWNSGLDIRSDFQFQYDRADGSGDSRQIYWTDSGDVRGSVVGLNVCYRFGRGRIRSHVTAGPALFHHRLDLTAYFGGGLTDTAETVNPPIDAIKIPILIEGESVSALGFNLGAGITFQLASRLALVVEGRYFLCPEAEFDWTIPAGTFDGIFYEGQIQDVYLSAADLRYVLDHRTLAPLKFHASQLQVRAGVKLTVGKGR